MEIWIDGKLVQSLPSFSCQEKLQRLRRCAVKFRWDENLYKFYLNALKGLKGKENNAAVGNQQLV